MSEPTTDSTQDDVADLPEELDLVTVSAFGHQWINYPTGLAEDLITLEREGAVYSHFADEGSIQPDGTATFSYYRIPFLPNEIFQYVEASLAYQEFHDAQRGGANFQEALRAISDPEIAYRVESYGDFGKSETRYGDIVDIRGCHASFYPPGLEELRCGQPGRLLSPSRSRFNPSMLAMVPSGRGTSPP